METWLANLDLPAFSKMKIIYINLFCVLYKAATLNLGKLLKDLREIEKAFPSQFSISVYIMQSIIPFFLLLKFATGFFSLTTKVIAMLPILSDDHPEMLLPCMMAQLLENILLPLFELILGFVACKYTESDCRSMLLVFTVSLVFRLFIGVIILSVYMNFYSKMLALRSHLSHRTHIPKIFSSEERFLSKKNLS